MDNGTLSIALSSAVLYMDKTDILTMRIVSRQCNGFVRFWSLHRDELERRWRFVRKRIYWRTTDLITKTLEALQERGVASPTTMQNWEAAQKMNVDLTQGATMGVLVDFSDDDGRACYTYSHLQSRSQIANTVLLMECPVMSWVRNHLFLSHPTCRVASIGGGPGFDALSLAVLAQHFHLACHIQLDVYDIESAWSYTIDALRSSGCMDPVHLNFSTGDIRQNVHSEANMKLGESLFHVNLFLFNYVCIENTMALQENDYCFLRSLFSGARPGAVMVFTDTSDRLWPEISALGGDDFLSYLLVFKRGKIAMVMVKLRREEKGNTSWDLYALSTISIRPHHSYNDKIKAERGGIIPETVKRNRLGERCLFLNGDDEQAKLFIKTAVDRMDKSKVAVSKRASRMALKDPNATKLGRAPKFY